MESRAWDGVQEFSQDTSHLECRAQAVLWVTAAMMVVEVVGGYTLGSMALLADGWHMGTHVAAFVVTLVAYRLMGRWRHDRRFSYGTQKISVLGGFVSALLLAGVALTMLLESVSRWWSPAPVHYGEAAAIAALGLSVNLCSAWLLRTGHRHAPGCQHDATWRAAYLHVVADALTSVMTLVALSLAWRMHWGALDAVSGCIGALVIMRWCWRLLRDTTLRLIDKLPDTQLQDWVERALSGQHCRLLDIRVVSLESGSYAVALTLVPSETMPVEYYRALLLRHPEITHLTIEMRGVSPD